MLNRFIILFFCLSVAHIANAVESSCFQLFSDIGRLDQRHAEFTKIGLVDNCTGRSNLCGPVSVINGLPTILSRSISEADAIQLVDKLVRRSGIDLASILSRGFWPFELKQAVERFFSDQNIKAEVRATGVHAFADNWDPGVFAAHVAMRQLPELNELTAFLSKSDTFTVVNFLGFADHQYATTDFDPTRAVQDFQQGRIFLAHYVTVDRVLNQREGSILVSGQDPMNGRVQFEVIAFGHPAFGSRIYRLKFVQPQSDRTFLVSALLQVNKK